MNIKVDSGEVSVEMRTILLVTGGKLTTLSSLFPEKLFQFAFKEALKHRGEENSSFSLCINSQMKSVRYFGELQ